MVENLGEAPLEITQILVPTADELARRPEGRVRIQFSRDLSLWEEVAISEGRVTDVALVESKNELEIALSIIAVERSGFDLDETIRGVMHDLAHGADVVRSRSVKRHGLLLSAAQQAWVKIEQKAG